MSVSQNVFADFSAIFATSLYIASCRFISCLFLVRFLLRVQGSSPLPISEVIGSNFGFGRFIYFASCRFISSSFSRAIPSSCPWFNSTLVSDVIQISDVVALFGHFRLVPSVFSGYTWRLHSLILNG